MGRKGVPRTSPNQNKKVAINRKEVPRTSPSLKKKVINRLQSHQNIRLFLLVNELTAKDLAALWGLALACITPPSVRAQKAEVKYRCASVLRSPRHRVCSPGKTALACADLTERLGRKGDAPWTKPRGWKPPWKKVGRRRGSTTASGCCKFQGRPYEGWGGSCDPGSFAGEGEAPVPEQGACAAAVKRIRGETKGPKGSLYKARQKRGTDRAGHRGTQHRCVLGADCSRRGRAKPSHLYQLQVHEGMTAAVVSRWGDTARVLGCAREGRWWASPVWCQQARRPDTCLPDLLAGAGSRPGEVPEAQLTLSGRQRLEVTNHKKDFKRGWPWLGSASTLKMMGWLERRSTATTASHQPTRTAAPERTQRNRARTLLDMRWFWWSWCLCLCLCLWWGDGREGRGFV